MKKVYQARNPTDAHLLKGVLETQDIEAIVQGDLLWSSRGEVPITPETCPSVWVADDVDYEKATQIIQDFQGTQTSGDYAEQEWKCPKCGESNEGQFSECWQCGTEREWRHQE